MLHSNLYGCNEFVRDAIRFFLEKVIRSREGTTQGDPLAMAMFGVAVLPLNDSLKDQNLTFKWFADDGNVVGSL